MVCVGELSVREWIYVAALSKQFPMCLHRYLWVLFAYLIMAPAEASEKEENFGGQDMKRGELFFE